MKHRRLIPFILIFTMLFPNNVFASAESEFQTALKTYQTAQSNYRTAKNNYDAKESVYDEKKDPYDNISQNGHVTSADVTDAENAYKLAMSEYNAVDTTSLKEESDADAIALNSVQTKVSLAKTQYELTQTNSANAKTRAEEANLTGDVEAAQTRVDAARADFEPKEAKYLDGAFGFLQEITPGDLTNDWENHPYFSYVRRGDINDATSIPNMRESIKWLKEYNRIRSEPLVRKRDEHPWTERRVITAFRTSRNRPQ